MKSFKLLAILFMSAIVPATLAGGARAGRMVALLGSNDVTSVSPAEESYSDFYVLEFTPPEGLTITTLEEAFLEFYVDASRRTDAEVLPAPARIEVYLLSGGLSGDVTKDDIVPHTRMTRSVPRGTNRFVRLNVTQAVREILKAPASNYGLVVGSLTGGRDSLFALKRGTFTGNADARLVFSTSD